jgi:ATP-dependent Lon protease
MSQFLPLFPLSLVVFPGEQLRLHIFEERYKQLISDCLETQSNFGIPTVIDQTVVSIATEVAITSVDKQYGSGELDLTTEGQRRFRIDKFYRVSDNKLYPGGDVAWLEDDDTPSAELQQEIFQLLEQLHEALGIQKKVADTLAGIQSYQIGHNIGLTLKQEYELLTLQTEIDRLMFIKQHLTGILPVVQETERMKARAKLNGHYKNIVPPNF